MSIALSWQKLVFCGLVVAAALFAVKAFHYRSKAIALENQRNEAVRLGHRDFAREVILRDAGLPSLEEKVLSREATLAVRDYISRGLNYADEDLPGSQAARLYASLNSSRNNMRCGGASSAYVWALEILGIRARTVQLAGAKFLAGEDVMHTHVTVEMWIDGKWEISDPLFNAAVECSNRPGINLSVPEARLCLERGQSLKVIGGKTPIQESRPNAGTLSEYFAAYIRRPTNVDPLEYFPSEDWLVKAESLYRR